MTCCPISTTIDLFPRATDRLSPSSLTPTTFVFALLLPISQQAFDLPLKESAAALHQ